MQVEMAAVRMRACVSAQAHPSAGERALQP